MPVGYAQSVKTVLPYTVGNGKPQYRTNPATGQKYTFAQLTTMVHNTAQEYNFSYVSQYVGDPQRNFDTQG